jgi:hypothetical protein
MTPEDMKAKLGIDDAFVTLSENGGYFHIHIDREKDGHRYRFNGNLAKNAGDDQIAELANEIGAWWNLAGIQY